MSKRAVDQWDWALLRRRCRAEALRLVRHSHDAEEVVQEALVRAWRSRLSCRTPEAPLPWCLQITRNEAFRLISRRKRLQVEDPLESTAELDDPASRSEIEHALERLDIERALGSLSAPEALLVRLRYEHDCSHPEIARALEIPEATARVRLHRLQQRLRPLLGADVRGGEEQDR